MCNSGDMCYILWNLAVAESSNVLEMITSWHENAFHILVAQPGASCFPRKRLVFAVIQFLEIWDALTFMWFHEYMQVKRRLPDI